MPLNHKSATAIRKGLLPKLSGSANDAFLGDGSYGKVSLASGVSGVLPEGNGGTNQSNYTVGDTLYASAANTLSKLAGNTTATRKFMRQTGTGAASQAPAWDTILAADIPGAALTKADDTNVTLTLGGSPSTALLNAASITAGWTGTLAAARLNSNVVQAITNDTNVTGTISAQNLTLGWTGTLSSARGGHGRTIKTLVSVNAAATDVTTFTGLPAKYRVLRLMVFEASTSLAASAATLGLFSASGGGGTAIVALSTLTNLSAAAGFVDLPRAITTALSGTYRTESTLYVRNGTAHGSAATVSVLLEIMDLT